MRGGSSWRPGTGRGTRRRGCPAASSRTTSRSSRKGVLRGLHYQKPFAQGKLLSVFEGEIFDVAVDIRRGSPDFGRWVGVAALEREPAAALRPPGFAHGFCVVSETALVTYKCTEVYHPEADRGVRWDDPAIGIDWPVDATPPSPTRTRRAPLLDAIAPDDLPRSIP